MTFTAFNAVNKVNKHRKFKFLAKK